LAVVENDLRQIVKTHFGFLVLNVDHAFILLALTMKQWVRIDALHHNIVASSSVDLFIVLHSFASI
jgi:hypothetical protein